MFTLYYFFTPLKQFSPALCRAEDFFKCVNYLIPNLAFTNGKILSDSRECRRLPLLESKT